MSSTVESAADDRHLSSDRWQLSRAEVAAIIGFWTLVGLLSVFQFSFDPRYGQPSSIWTAEAAHRAAVFACWCLLTPVIFWFSHRFGPERVDWRKFVVVYAGVGIAIAVALHLFIHVLWNVMVPNDPRSTSITYVTQGLHFLPEFLTYLLILAAGFARDYAVRYRKRVLESAQLKAETTELESRLRTKEAELKAHFAEARLQALRTQVHPHFLFNTLNAITSLAHVDPRSVGRLVNRLSEILRYTLTHSEDTEVALRKELRFIDRYLEIQQIRFGDRLEIVRDVDPETLDALVPSFILQPVVEHAIKHGVDPIDGRGRIELSAWRDQDNLCLSVREHVPRLSVSASASIEPFVGTEELDGHLAKTDERLAMLYGKRQHLVLETDSAGGHRATIRIPFRTQGPSTGSSPGGDGASLP